MYSQEAITYRAGTIDKDGVIGKPIEIVFSNWELELVSDEKPTINPDFKKIDGKIVNFTVIKCEIS